MSETDLRNCDIARVELLEIVCDCIVVTDLGQFSYIRILILNLFINAISRNYILQIFFDQSGESEKHIGERTS